MKVALLSANLGGFEQPIDHVAQEVPPGVELTVRRITDADFPRRVRTMTARLQMGIVKRFAWEWVPDHEVYIWIDSSVRMTQRTGVKWFLRILGSADLALLPHPHRHSIREEADFLWSKLGVGDQYLTIRYENERLADQLAVIESDPTFVDDTLYASTAFAFRDSPGARAMFKEWFHHVNKYHALDQLSFPYVVRKSGLVVHELPGNLYRHPELTYTRGKRREPEVAHG